MPNHERSANCTTEKITVAALLGTCYWLLDTGVLLATTSTSLLQALYPGGIAGLQRLLISSGLAAVAFGIATIYQRYLSRTANKLSSCDLQYRSVLRSTFDSIFFLGSDTEIIEANTAGARAFGSPAGTLEGRSFDTLVTSIRDPLPGGANTIAELLAAEPTQQHGPIQIVCQFEDGRRFPAEINIVPTCYGDDSDFSVYLRELTEQVRAREALRQTEDEYRTLFDQIPVGIYRNLPDGTILTANLALLDILGVESLDELVNTFNVVDFYPRPHEREERVARLIDEREIHNLQIEILRPDGSSRTALTSATALCNDPEHEIVIQGTLLDITDLQRVRDALKDRDETLRSLTENSLDMVLIVDDRGRIIYCSPSSKRFTGRTAEELLGMHTSDIVHADDAEHIKRAMRKGLRKPDIPNSATCRVLRKDGTIVAAEALSRTFKDSSGKARSVINVRDISERQSAAIQLQHAQKMQAVGQLTGGIAHDFNNLLMIIVGNLQLLREQSLDPKTCSQIDSALQACVRGGDLTRRLLAMARQQPLEPRVVNVNKLLSSIDPLLQRSLSKSMRIETVYTAEPWLTKVDPSQLESALLNLAINSRDATDREGKLTVRTFNRRLDADTWTGLKADEVGDYVCIEVVDNGSGMEVDVLKQAVDPFFTTKKDDGGTGLGLSMVYGFVQQSGGHMRIESESGVGTRIEIYLPRTDEVETVVDDAADQLDMPFGGESILVVDDNDEVRNSAAALIKRLGYRVRKADSGQIALKMLQAESADLVFSDIMMPEMSGFDLAEQVTNELPDVNILLTTGYADDSIFAVAEDRNQYDILYKPYNQIELAKRIRGALDN